MLGSSAQAAAPSTGTLLVRGSALRVLTLVVSVAVSFFLMPFLIHALGDRWYGMWALIGSITSYYALLDLGLTSAVNRFLTQAIARDDETDANAVIVTALAIFGGIGGGVLLVSIAVAFSAGWFLDEPEEIAVFRHAVVILGADVALAFPFAVFNGLLVAHYRFDIVAATQLAALALRTALIVYVIGRGHSIVALAVITLAVSLASRLVLAIAARRLFPSLRLSRAHFRRAQARALFGYGRYAFIAAAADRIRFQIDTLVVGAFLGVALVTHYAIAVRLAQLFMDLMIRTLGVVGPVFMRLDAHGDPQRMRDTFLLATRLSVLASVTIAGSIVIFGERFIELWIGEDYRDAHWPLVILTGSLAVALMQFPSVSVLFATARHRFYAHMNSGEAVANLVLSLILVQPYGMIGVSLGTAVPLLFTKLVVQPRYVCRALAIELRAYYLEICRGAFIAAASQLPLLALVKLLGAPSMSAILALAVAYYPICWVLLVRGTVPVADRNRIGDALPKLKWLNV